MRKLVLPFVVLGLVAFMAGSAAAGVAGTPPQSKKAPLVQSTEVLPEYYNFDDLALGDFIDQGHPDYTSWDTWSGGGGTSEDCDVSDAFSRSADNSIVITLNEDVVRRHGDVTTGSREISFWIYIPAGASGYFNNMSGFDTGFEWAMECYFDAGGGARLLTADPDVLFAWSEDTWHHVELTVDLDADLADFYFDDVLLHSFTWSADGGTNRLSVTDFFGAASTDEMYVDDYHVVDPDDPCYLCDVTLFQAKCVDEGGGTWNLKFRLVSLNNVIEGCEDVTFDVNGTEYVRPWQTNGTHSRALNQTFGNPAGVYTVSLLAPEQCHDPIVLSCGVDGVPSGEWEDLDLGFGEDTPGNMSLTTVPVETELLGNYPNPFNPSTTISYALANEGFVSLKIYNTLGQEVATLVNEFQSAGTFEATWNGTNDFGAAVSSGIYLYRLQANDVVFTEKMMFMK